MLLEEGDEWGNEGDEVESFADSDNEYKYGINAEFKGDACTEGINSGIIVSQGDVIRQNIRESEVCGSGEEDFMASGDELANDGGENDNDDDDDQEHVGRCSIRQICSTPCFKWA